MPILANVFGNYSQNLVFDCAVLAPELILAFTVVWLLVMRLMPTFNRLHLSWVALVFTLIALAVSWFQWSGQFYNPQQLAHGEKTHDMFSGMLVYDNLTIFIRLFLLAFVALLIWLSMLTGIPDREDSADFYCLLLGATLGMMLMASANHLLMVYIAVEMASLPSYALAGFLKGRRQSSEASLKYVVYGGGASGIMLYGISLLAGKFGTAYLPDVAAGYLEAVKQASAMPLQFDPILVLGTLFLFIGLAFKLAAVPFHFWCPDVFEGASTEVAAFLSVASKGAALALVARLSLILVGLSNPEFQLNFTSWLDVARYLGPALAVAAALTATFGNLAAYAQTNMKRLLAYSTIAHAGYMLMGLAVLNKEGATAVLYYLIAYLVMNLGAFAIVAFLRNQTGSEDLSTYSGLVQRSPIMTVLLSIFLLSLLGIPPLAGFAAKVQVFLALYHAGQDYSSYGQSGLGTAMYALLVIGGINTVLSAVYYLNVLKVMILDRPEEAAAGLTPAPVRTSAGASVYGTVLAALIFVVFFWPALWQAPEQGVDRFHKVPPPGPSVPGSSTAEVSP
jgi:NADH-quinone oxidoreductase subunit N